MSGRRSQNIDLKDGIFIIGEGITEQYYFSHLKKIKGFKCAVKPRFFGNTNIFQIEKAVKKLLAGDATVICLFDCDVSKRNSAENSKLIQFRKEYGKDERVIICDSLPSIEFWFLLHFVKTNRHYRDSKEVEKELKKYIKNYSKSTKFLQDSGWVKELSERLEIAMDNVTSLKIHESSSYSNVYRAIEKLN